LIRSFDEFREHVREAQENRDHVGKGHNEHGGGGQSRSTILFEKRGISIETKQTYFDADYEFDIYGSDGEVTVIGETKLRASPVAEVVNRVREDASRWPDKFKDKIVALYCMRTMPGDAFY